MLDLIPNAVGDLLWLSWLHGAWIGLLVPAAIALILSVPGMRTRSHESRHRLALAGLIAVAAGPPIVALAHPAREAEGPPSIPQALGAVAWIAEARAAPDRMGLGRPLPSDRGPAWGGSLAGRGVARALAFVRPIVVAGWFVGVLGLGILLMAGAWRMERLRRGARAAPEAIQERARSLSRGLRMRGSPSVRVLDRLDEPCLLGVRRPAVVLPSRWLAVARPEMVDAVLAHELAHARRRDHLVNLAQRGVELVLFAHPGVHWLSREVRRHREFCADAMAVRLTGDPIALAGALESVARFRSDPGPGGSSPPGVAFGGRRETLLSRVQELLGMTPNRDRFPVWPLAALPLAAVLALVAASADGAQDDDGAEPTPAPNATAPGRVVPRQEEPRAVLVPPFDDPHRPPFGRVDWPQIAYEVHFIQCDTIQFEKGEHVRMLASEPDGSLAVVLDGRSSMVMMGRGEITWAPKVTGFEMAEVTVGNMHSQDPEEQFLVKASGVIENDGGIWLSATVGDNERAPWYRGASLIPEGGSLAIRAPDRRKAANAKRPRGVRLIVVTPRRIILEEEEEPFVLPTVPNPVPE